MSAAPADKTTGLRSLRGVGPKLEEKLQALGVNTVTDLLFHLPYRYEDRTRIRRIGELQAGEQALVEGEIEHSAIVRGRRPMLLVAIADGTGTLVLRFFHFRAAQKNALSTGTRLRCYGEARYGRNSLEMVHPSYQRIDENTPPPDSLTPVYPSTEGLHQTRWKQLTDQALDRMCKGQLELEDLLAESALDLPPLAEALMRLHRPPKGTSLADLESGDNPWRRRLVTEELLAHHLGMRRLHEARLKWSAPALPAEASMVAQLIEELPFRLTGAQQRVIGEIRGDLAGSRPMQRLLQGDVGSGKTVVAAAAALQAMDAGWQVAMTAPTELLAEQHRDTLSQWLRPLGITPVWLSGKVTGRARGRALEAISDGAPLVVGTHALMQEGVEFSQLGLVIVDEQHRFGVHQRLSLRQKGRAGQRQPHQLIMTATPIPRTLAMTAYAGLETSVIDELPPGRQPVKTVAISQERRDEVIERVAAAVSEGQQAYWVCTLIEESEALEAEAAEATAESLSESLTQLNIGLIHGRLKPADKQRVMAAFKLGEIDLLVATTVIEVGVDVPNASLMIIDNAERLGLAQLHQLRGRVGRGNQSSACVLLYKPPLGETARARLQTLRETNDGFRIAEKDLELRGPGEVLGTRQTGAMQFRIADLTRDQSALRQIPKLADQLLQNHPDIADALIQRWVGSAEQFAEA